VRERGVFEVGDDLFDDGVVTVGGLGGEYRLGVVYLCFRGFVGRCGQVAGRWPAVSWLFDAKYTFG